MGSLRKTLCNFGQKFLVKPAQKVTVPSFGRRADYNNCVPTVQKQNTWQTEKKPSLSLVKVETGRVLTGVSKQPPPYSLLDPCRLLFDTGKIAEKSFEEDTPKLDLNRREKKENVKISGFQENRKKEAQETMYFEDNQLKGSSVDPPTDLCIKDINKSATTQAAKPFKEDGEKGSSVDPPTGLCTELIEDLATTQTAKPLTEDVKKDDPPSLLSEKDPSQSVPTSKTESTAGKGLHVFLGVTRNFVFSLAMGLLLLLPGSGSAKPVTPATCRTDSCDIGEPTFVTCLFDRNVFDHKLDISIVLHPYNTSKVKDVLLCTWMNGEPQCFVESGYEFNGDMDEGVTLGIPSASPEIAGGYACHAAGENLPPEACNLTVKAQERRTLGQTSTGATTAITTLMIYPQNHHTDKSDWVLQAMLPNLVLFLVIIGLFAWILIRLMTTSRAHSQNTDGPSSSSAQDPLVPSESVPATFPQVPGPS